MLTREETQKLTEEAVIELVNAQKTFTPFDVTTQLRSSGHQVEHLYVREHVRNMMYAAIQAGLLYDFSFVEYPVASGGTVEAITFAPVSPVAQPAATTQTATTNKDIWSFE